MPRLMFALSPDGLLLPAFLGLDAAAMQDLLSQGMPVPRPIQVQTQIDTGSLVTGVTPRLIRAIGAAPGGSARTLTAGGFAFVPFYRISFTLFDNVGASISRTSWLVTNLPQDLPDVDVLFGMDLVREHRLVIDGLGAYFSIDS